MSKNRTLIGRVVSDKMQKTLTVLIENQVRHSIYKKYIGKSKKYHVHDEHEQFKKGDTVEIVESKPISRSKSWIVTRLIASIKEK